jgi:hypothetical protein
MTNGGGRILRLHIAEKVFTERTLSVVTEVLSKNYHNLAQNCPNASVNYHGSFAAPGEDGGFWRLIVSSTSLRTRVAARIRHTHCLLSL